MNQLYDECEDDPAYMKKDYMLNFLHGATGVVMIAGIWIVSLIVSGGGYVDVDASVLDSLPEGFLL